MFLTIIELMGQLAFNLEIIQGCLNDMEEKGLDKLEASELLQTQEFLESMESSKNDIINSSTEFKVLSVEDTDVRLLMAEFELCSAKIMKMIHTKEGKQELVDQVDADIEMIERLLKLKKIERKKPEIDTEASVFSLRYRVLDYKEGSCPYCKKKVSTKYIAVSNQLSVEDYENVLERGFVLDGSYIILQEPSEVCCIYRHIRTEANKFKRRKCQKKAWNRWNRFLKGERGILVEGNDTNTSDDYRREVLEGANRVISGDEFLGNLKNFLRGFVIEENLEEAVGLFKIDLDKKSKEGCSLVSNFLIKMFWNNKRRKDGKLFKMEFEDMNSYVEELGGKFTEFLGKSDLASEWKISVQNKGYLKFERKISTQEQDDVEGNDKTPKKREEWGFDLYEKKKRNLEFILKKAEFSEEKAELYADFNVTIHNKDRPSHESFKRFLCTQSLMYKHFRKQEQGASKEPEDITNLVNSGTHEITSAPNELHLGCYHIEMKLDGVLIGVLVHQYLYSGLISTYFFYNPIFQHLSIGIVTALMEINMVQERSKYFPDFKYYYLYTYIYGNKRVAYKTDFKPVEFYCRQTRTWVDLDEEVWEKLKNDDLRLANNTTEKNISDDFSGDFLGYLAESLSTLQPISPVNDLTDNPDHRNFDLENVDYQKLNVNVSPQAFSYYVRCMITMYPIIDCIGRETFSRSYWDVSLARRVNK